MGRVTYQENYTVEVEPAYNQFYTRRSDAIYDQKMTAEKLMEQIKRHCDGVQTVTLKYHLEHECEFCGAAWTEGDSPHNGGCCPQDAKVMLARTEDAIPELKALQITQD